MAALTTERTTAFMPALSPPEVRTAIFIVVVDDYGISGARFSGIYKLGGDNVARAGSIEFEGVGWDGVISGRDTWLSLAG